MKQLQIVLLVIAAAASFTSAVTFTVYGTPDENCANPHPLLGCPKELCVFEFDGKKITKRVGDPPFFKAGMGKRGNLCLHCEQCTYDGMQCFQGPTKSLRKNGRCK